MATPIIVVTGPLAGIPGLSGSRWQICSKSPSVNPETFSYSNLGGMWGATLKFAGFDALVIKGMANKPAYLYIHDGICEYEDASDLWGLSATLVRAHLKSKLGHTINVLAIGPAGENMVSFATILADDDASASSGFGAVMGVKNLKVIAVAGRNQIAVDSPEILQELTRFLRRVKKGEPQEALKTPKSMKTKRQACFGCIAGCARSLFISDNNLRGKYLCTSGFFYEDWALKYYGELNEVPFLATRLCDDYGLDANVIYTIIPWLLRCYKEGITSEESVGLPISRIGSLEFIRELVWKISRREGFGDVLALGMPDAAHKLGADAETLVLDSTFKDGSYAAYCPRMYITNSLIWAFEPRQSFPLSGEVGRTVLRWLDWLKKSNGSHSSADRLLSPPRTLAGRSISDGDLKFIARHFWGGEAAADFTSINGKAKAAKMIQDRHYVKESAVLCNFSWHVTSIELLRPMIISEVLSAVTGVPYDEQDIFQLGERIFNLQHAIHVRERRCGREDDALPKVWHTHPLQESFMNPDLLVPDFNGEPVTRRNSVLDRGQFEALKDEYYHLRGWDVATGLQTESKLNDIGLTDVAVELKRLNLSR